jgi:hexokinase
MRRSVSGLFLSLYCNISQLTRDSVDDDLASLSSELSQELRKLEHIFTVDAAKLKEITLQFEHELRQGLSRVSRCLLPSSVSPFGSSHIYMPV